MNDPRPCRYCSKPVIDGFDAAGKRIILSARNHPIYVLMPDGTWARASETTKLSHFVDCAKVEEAKADQAAKKAEPECN